MTDRVLVVSTVHHPDDTRIREKTIRALSARFDVIFAAREPGPSDITGMRFVSLRGNRIRRNLAAWWLVLTTRVQIVSIHDPELLPLGLVARLVRRRTVVFDMHEDVPAQILTKTWLPRPVRAPMGIIAAWLLKLSERLIVVTLAEASYQRRFNRPHPVIANYPQVNSLPRSDPSAVAGGAVYVGDVTVERGLLDAVTACGGAGVALLIVGPVSDVVSDLLRAEAREVGADVTFTGRIPHEAAMAAVAMASVALSPLHDLANYRHSIPTKILEYLAIGVPVVASDLPATREIVEGLDAVELFAPGDTAAMTTALIAAMRPESGLLARRQVDEVRSKFQWPADALVGIYERS